jgi:hypothetical protein
MVENLENLGSANSSNGWQLMICCGCLHQETIPTPAQPAQHIDLGLAQPNLQGADPSLAGK